VAPLQQELIQLGRSLDDVRGIVLTHGNTDHIGFADLTVTVR
jgi:glyoxylase-like metal-dependent hydrolase (beta-lactamase superfamily II)